MIAIINKIVSLVGIEIVKKRRYKPQKVDASIFEKYVEYTMIPHNTFVSNLELCAEFGYIKGCVVECGVWRGGMIAGIAELLGDRNYYLFDSFEGLPEAQNIDGENAIKWQKDTQSPIYFDNCKAEMDWAEKAMSIANKGTWQLIKGWFSDTLPTFTPAESIAILRLDGDWYESTMTCLEHLYPFVCEGGLIIIDDYYVWEGCSKAVHDYFSKNNLPLQIRQTSQNVCFIINKK